MKCKEIEIQNTRRRVPILWIYIEVDFWSLYKVETNKTMENALMDRNVRLDMYGTPCSWQVL